MWKLLVAFAVFAALAIWLLTKSGGNLDMSGEKHDVSAPAAEASAPVAPASAASQ